MIIFHGGCNPYCPRPASPGKKCWHVIRFNELEANSALRRADYACRFQRHRQELRKWNSMPFLRWSSAAPAVGGRVGDLAPGDSKFPGHVTLKNDRIAFGALELANELFAIGEYQDVGLRLGRRAGRL